MKLSARSPRRSSSSHSKGVATGAPRRARTAYGATAVCAYAFRMPRAELADLIKDLTAQMMAAARDLQFELAARIRDEIADLKKELRGMDAAGLK